MVVDVIDPIGDRRISHCKAILNGKTYHYLLGVPEERFQWTIFLIHGWPDLSMGWRYQIPKLLQMGLRVVCPDMIGYGETDAPIVPPESVSLYSYKRAADDLKELASHLGVSRVILGGHDWGGAVVYRTAMWYPDLVSHLVSVCTPFFSVTKEYVPLQQLVNTVLPNFRYQLQLASGDVEKGITSKEQIRQFLSGMYGARGPGGEFGFSTSKGVILENLPRLGASPLLNEREMDYYVDQYAKNGLHGPLNWYRTREINYQDELQLKVTTIDVPVLFIQATKDHALPPAMSANMEQHIPNLTRKEVQTSHWALWEAPEQVNDLIEEWLKAAIAKESQKSVL